ncbi:RIIa domain-containing protein [Aphelenchoides fujianensis]|nr:RIIa domain-containing protein [Aphelenchoides fujianensis]
MAESISSSKYKVPASLRPLLEAKKLYGQFRSNLQQKLAARESTPDATKQEPFDSTQPSSQRQSVGDQGPPPLQLQSQTSEPLAEQTNRSSSAFQSPNHSVSNSKANTSRSKMQQVQQSHPGSSHNTGRASPTELAAATKIQAVRNHPEKFGIDTVDMSRRGIPVGGYTLENASPDDRAATKIQAEIRGFLARKHVEALKQQNEKGSDENSGPHSLDGVASPSRSSLHSTKSDEVVH